MTVIKDPNIILFGKHKGTAFCDIEADYLQWLSEHGDGEAKDLAKAVLAERDAPAPSVDGGGNIDEPMSNPNHLELDGLFDQYGQKTMWWSQFKVTYPEALDITVHGHFKSILEGGLEFGVEWDQIQGKLEKIITELGIGQ